MSTLRQLGGLSVGFRSAPKASTTPLAPGAFVHVDLGRAGMAAAARQKGEDRHAVGHHFRRRDDRGAWPSRLNNAGVQEDCSWWCSTTTTCRSACLVGRPNGYLAQLMSGQFYVRQERGQDHSSPVPPLFELAV